ncbi:tungsten ABC transporter substrate-binding protein [Anaerosalibacter bizertensis]|uniref:Substrate-binding domain-containing protein n=1 Tax=Anaerosalibacter bizertensis TaxID=932217 RepID=A0A844FFB0_9FIRM|nr:substrate-binding domain-containing protein [Anaerosalibacter bizertensis]MBV1817528.1 substrate-binding domain-containing protein [Bacteroidales bacterium MSK.15.36]MBU5293656.1 substrate-binding domain-containing protein [Anaerosalibacter bizertensis]MCB5559452.1 substrate-binding domain-containing protein [Anaerosalibacter bizertensis]MCG4565078.1 substrate-binding domain-containing protein [Anaerosalibacter bizertensis]MCG4582362.1 substrate-binding domain-containing protein [Anaerosali
MKKKTLILFVLVLALSLAGCGNNNESSEPAEKETPKENREMILATTTSTQDSGLLDYLLPIFKEDTGIDVKVVAVGTGEALKLGENGDADCLLVHAKEKEEEFIKNGYGVERHDVMYNDFIIVGPEEDPAKVKENAPNDVVEAFKAISENEVDFVSRGDESGTHVKENGIWEVAEIEPTGDWYISAGKGMGAVLQMADEKKAYTLTDRATYLSMEDDLDLVIVTEKDERLYNQYGVIMLNTEKHDIKEEESKEFIDWMLSEKGQKLIGEYGKEEYGQALFIPNAEK